MKLCMGLPQLIKKQILVPVINFVKYVTEVCEEVQKTFETVKKELHEQCNKVTSKVCKWLPWPADQLCKLVTKTVCKMVEVAITVVETVTVTVCKSVTSFLKFVTYTPLNFFVTIISVVCFIVFYIVSWIKLILSFILAVPECALMYLLGIQVRKHLHICVTVLADEGGNQVVDDVNVDGALVAATRIISRRFVVSLHVDDKKVVKVSDDHLDVTACDISQLFSAEAHDLSVESSEASTFVDLLDCGVDFPVVVGEILHVIFIRKIIEGGDVGCHIPGTNYVIVDQSASGLVLAHEIGHAGNLWHVSAADNLMNHNTADDEVNWWQRCIFRASRFVGYTG